MKRSKLHGVKIFQDDNKITTLPDNFQSLDDSFCSLFQTHEWYRKLLSDERIRRYADNILSSLNDLTIRKDLFKKVKDTDWLNVSLLRFSEANSILNTRWVMTPSFIYNYTFNWQSVGTVNFDFEYNSILPYRTNVLIGKNWSWKTTLLASLANTLVGYWDDIYWNISKIPKYSKVIAISYSVFDNFKTPQSANPDISYIYCWLRNSEESNSINTTILWERFIKWLSIIEKKWQKNIWNYLLQDLFDNEINLDLPLQNYTLLSSWQKILVTIFTEILANIEQRSLLLFDEPETHLHPNIIFKLIKVLNKILEDYNSYLVIATHSTIVLQQIPSQNVILLNRSWSYVSVSGLTEESFWENFSTITKEVFWNYESTDIFYKEVFNEASERFTEEEILKAFNNRLNLNAKIYLKNIFNQKENEKN